MINMLAHNAIVTPKPEDQLTKGIDRRQKKMTWKAKILWQCIIVCGFNCKIPL